MSKLHLSVGGMHCSLCIKSITRALTRMDGVVSAHVSLAHQEVLVDYDATRIYPDQMIRTLSALGFKPQEPEQAALSEEEELVKSKRIAAVAVVLLSLATTI
ncbi:MAG: heavy-metal-associated domain-containing protein, partial [Symbiobacteriaceae bacterium]|nr:heavy-metal-associated domain-containing protein [Symbiobacteriaceae bacterium]